MKKIITLIISIMIVASMAVTLTSCVTDSANNEPKIKMVNIPLTDEEYAIAIDKSKPQLEADINAALANIDVTAILDAENAGTAKSHAFPSSAEGVENPLIVATNAEFAPFEYKVGDEYAGIDIEILVQVAEALGKNIVLLDMDFDAVVLSVGPYADIAIAGLTVTDERKETVNFSNTYFNSSQVLLVKNDDTTFDDCKNAADVEAILAASTGKKAGAQVATVGADYINGSEDFDGYSNITMKTYDSFALAAQDLINGNIDFVVVDVETAKSIIKKMA